MAKMIINIPDSEKDRVLNGFCLQHGWTADKGAKATFAKSKVIQFIKDTVAEYESGIAMDAAKKSTQQDINKIIIS